ncbi:MAG: S-layer homology domain-containing protein [Deltaproteobacteria bacterium]|nr:S-layer homology domain-containing protein [Deltaproteobacteria bacterium]MBW2081746.1 S-layer homology domain-containing protein [Deltaproteobacteria bacterium]
MGYIRKAGSKRAGICLMLCIGVLCLSACVPATREFVLDSPEHRLTNGVRLLELGRIEDARYEFRMAFKLDPTCCTAIRGIAISLGLQERFEEAFRTMAHAKSCSKDDRDRSMAAVGFMRLCILRKATGWIERTENFFTEALEYFPSNFEAYYYMGLAYGQAGMFPKALWAFREAVKIGGSSCSKAKEELDSVKKVIEASPESDFARSVAFKDALTRADVAVLFIEELHLDKVYKERGIGILGEMNYPAASSGVSIGNHLNRPKGGLNADFFPPQDVVKHPYRDEISKVLRLGIQGLTLLPDGGFGPDLQVTRSEFATIVADILRKTAIGPLAGRSKNSERAVFSDISDRAPYLSDVLLCTTHLHLMATEQGLFHPMELLSGPDALLTISKLKDLLR